MHDDVTSWAARESSALKYRLNLTDTTQCQNPGLIGVSLDGNIGSAPRLGEVVMSAHRRVEKIAGV